MKYFLREIAYCLIMLIHRVRNRKLIVGFRAKAPIDARFIGYNKLMHHSFFSGELGYGSYVGAYSVVAGKIGKYCSIADRVTFLGATHPVKNYVSTHPSFYSLKKQNGMTYADRQLFDEYPKLPGSSYSIEIGNDVYIGYGAVIIGPCRIGDGAVVAAGAVVTGDVPDYCIVGGVPAKQIRMRFSEEQITFLKELRWWDKTPEWLSGHVELFTSIDSLCRAYEQGETE